MITQDEALVLALLPCGRSASEVPGLIELRSVAQRNVQQNGARLEVDRSLDLICQALAGSGVSKAQPACPLNLGRPGNVAPLVPLHALRCDGDVLPLEVGLVLVCSGTNLVANSPMS